MRKGKKSIVTEMEVEDSHEEKKRKVGEGPPWSALHDIKDFCFLS